MLILSQQKAPWLQQNLRFVFHGVWYKRRKNIEKVHSLISHETRLRRHLARGVTASSYKLHGQSSYLRDSFQRSITESPRIGTAALIDQSNNAIGWQLVISFTHTYQSQHTRPVYFSFTRVHADMSRALCIAATGLEIGRRFHGFVFVWRRPMRSWWASMLRQSQSRVVRSPLGLIKGHSSQRNKTIPLTTWPWPEVDFRK
jgi:hypothetical protein